MTYVYLMNNHKELTFDIIQKHVDHLKKLDDEGKLVLCGPFADFPGGMVVFNANSREEAVSVAESDPFIASDNKTYELRCLEVANAENNYLIP